MYDLEYPDRNALFVQAVDYVIARLRELESENKQLREKLDIATKEEEKLRGMLMNERLYIFKMKEDMKFSQ